MKEKTPRYHLNLCFSDNTKKYDNIVPIQIGRLYCHEQMSYTPHKHADFFELTIVRAGEGFVGCNGVETPVKAGDIYVSLPFDEHSVTSSAQNPLEYDFCSFKLELGEFHDEIYNLVSLNANPTKRVFADAFLSSLLENVVMEFIEPRIHSEILIELAFKQIIIHLIRNFSDVSPTSKIKNISFADELTYKVMNYVQTNIFTITSIKDISNEFGYNNSYLSTRFKKNTNKNISEYVLEVKMQKAKELIEERKLTLTAIAEKLNYSSVYSFSKAFKKFYNISPLTYKESLN